MSAPTTEQRHRLQNSVVPKALRARALELTKMMPRGEKRSHAFSWVKGSMRTTEQIQRFIERMEAAE